MVEIRFSVLLIACVISNSAGLSLTPYKKAIQSRLLASTAECLKDHPLTKEQITSMKAKKLPEDDGAKCFAACLFRNFGVFDEKGIVSVSGALNSAKKVFNNEEEYVAKVEEIVQTCSSVNDKMVVNKDADEICERATFLFECLVENESKIGVNLNF